MPSVPWVPVVRQVVDGQPVSARYTNSAIKDLIQRTDYLFENANNQEATKLVVRDLSSFSDINIDVGLIDYDVVTFVQDPPDIKLVKSSATPNSNLLFTAGVLLGDDIVSYGVIDLAVDILEPDDVSRYMLALDSFAVKEFWIPGPYFLSQAYPGKITSSPVASDARVRVGYYLGQGKFLVDVHVLSESMQHKHVTQIISVPLLAPEPIFIPVNPVPFGNPATLLFVNGKLARYGVDYSVVTIGPNTGVQWVWLTDNTDPMDVSFDPRAFMIGPDDELLITFAIPTGTPTGVTSLVAGNGNVIITDCSANPASKGDLKIQAITRFAQDSATKQGCNVLKIISYSDVDDKVHYESGPVVEKLEAGPGIVLEQFDTNAFPCSEGQGRLRVSVSSEGQYDEIPAVALRNAKEGVIGLCPFISLIKTYASGFISKKRLHPAVNPAKPINLILDYFIPAQANNLKVVLEIKYLVTPQYTSGGVSTPTLSLTPFTERVVLNLGSSHNPDRPARLATLTLPPERLFAPGFLSLQITRLHQDAEDTLTVPFNVLQLGYTFNN